VADAWLNDLGDTVSLEDNIGSVCRRKSLVEAEKKSLTPHPCVTKFRKKTFVQSVTEFLDRWILSVKNHGFFIVGNLAFWLRIAVFTEISMLRAMPIAIEKAEMTNVYLTFEAYCIDAIFLPLILSQKRKLVCEKTRKFQLLKKAKRNPLHTFQVPFMLTADRHIVGHLI
jgi:hypothetical protein